MAMTLDGGNERVAYLVIWAAVIAGHDSRNFCLYADSHVATVGEKGLHCRMLHGCGWMGCGLMHYCGGRGLCDLMGLVLLLHLLWWEVGWSRVVVVASYEYKRLQVCFSL